MPGRKARISPLCSARAERMARAIASGRSRGRAMSRVVCWTSTGNMRPALSTISAPISGASRAPSAVADIAIRRNSGRSMRCKSRQKASARSDSSDRSWISSRMTAATPSRPGSDCRRRTSRPSVMTSIRVSADVAESRRVRNPTVRPTCSPSKKAMRLAAALVARRRGSSIRIFWSPRHDAPCNASGTSVVLPAPGGATSTALRPASSKACNAGSASVTGRSGRSGMTRAILYEIRVRLAEGSPCRVC